MSDNLLDLKEVMARLKISRTTLYNLIETGKITPIEKPEYLKKRGKVQFRESDVNKLLKKDPTNSAA